ncbi:MAG: hypothetical protein IJM83_03425 [Firmicutes bacterium]|nr:hypothetical protein [Bacillota bacterium]
MGLFGPTYAAYDTIEAAKRIQEKAVNDRSYDTPAKEAKLLKKLASENDNRKLFYFSLVNQPMIRRAAISRIADPRAISMLVRMYKGNSETLRCCAESPVIQDSDLSRIIFQGIDYSKPGSGELEKYILMEKIRNEYVLVDTMLRVGEELRLAVLPRLREKQSLIDLVTSASGKTRETAIGRLLESWPDSAGEDLTKLTIRQVHEHKYGTAADFREQLQLSDERLDREILAAIKEDALLYDPESMDYDFVLAFLDHSNENVNKAGNHPEQDILRAALSKLTEEQVLALTKDRRKSNPEVMESVLGFLSEKTLQKVALNNKAWGLPAAIKAGKETLVKLYEKVKNQVRPDEVLLRNCLREIRDENDLVRLMEKYPEDGERISRQILSVSGSEELIIRCLKEYPFETETVLKKLSPEGRKNVALYAKSEEMRSLAAKTLLDTGHVRVLRNRCRYCGGEVETIRVQAETIEAHNFYRCKQCGRSEHETILDYTPLGKDQYIYEN